jgi:hypothetical protein
LVGEAGGHQAESVNRHQAVKSWTGTKPKLQNCLAIYLYDMRVIFGLIEMDSFGFFAWPNTQETRFVFIGFGLQGCNAATDVVHFLLLQIGRMQAAKSRPFSMGRHAGAKNKTKH